MKYFKLLFLVLIISLGACQSINKNLDNTALYQASIASAMAPTADKVNHNLIGITPKNTDLIRKSDNKDYILVVTWKQDTSYYTPYLDSASYNTGDYSIWVTTAPELWKRMKAEKAIDVDLRLKQLLGLPPNAEYSYFMEMWVKPEDLFRPCPDSEITDQECELCFPDSTDSSYISWINENRISRYYQRDLYDKYPWTQLGYTYDWNAKNSTHIGLSEFVIAPHKDIIIKAIYTTADYLNKNRE